MDSPIIVNGSNRTKITKDSHNVFNFGILKRNKESILVSLIVSLVASIIANLVFYCFFSN